MNVAISFVEAENDERYHVDAIEDPFQKTDKFYETANIHEDHEDCSNQRLKQN
jgi:hypothetical protein